MRSSDGAVASRISIWPAPTLLLRPRHRWRPSPARFRRKVRFMAGSRPLMATTGPEWKSATKDRSHRPAFHRERAHEPEGVGLGEKRRKNGGDATASTMAMKQMAFSMLAPWIWPRQGGGWGRHLWNRNFRHTAYPASWRA